MGGFDIYFLLMRMIKFALVRPPYDEKIYGYIDLGRRRMSSTAFERHHTARDGSSFYISMFSQWDIKKSSFTPYCHRDDSYWRKFWSSPKKHHLDERRSWSRIQFQAMKLSLYWCRDEILNICWTQKTIFVLKNRMPTWNSTVRSQSWNTVVWLKMVREGSKFGRIALIDSIQNLMGTISYTYIIYTYILHILIFHILI